MNISVWALYNGKVLQDITPMVKSIQTSMDKEQVSRKFDIVYAYPIKDCNQPKYQVNPGTYISINLDGKEIFRGWVHEREINSASEEITFTAYDCMVYFLKSNVTYNFQNLESEACVEQIAKDLKVKYNYIPTTKIKINRVIQDKSAYEAIMEIYTQVSKSTGKKYMPYADYDMLSVMERGKLIQDIEQYKYTSGTATIYKNKILSPYTNLSGSVYKDTIENMVNKIKVYDDTNKFIGEVKNDSSINFYGIFQGVYQKEDDKDWNSVARTMLHDIDREFNLTALGDWRCRTGYALSVQIPYIDTYQNKIVYIDSDTHTWELSSGLYTMDLKLSCTNDMDIKE